MTDTNLFLKLTKVVRRVQGRFGVFENRVQENMNYYERLDIRPGIICQDGFQISIQASKCHYCTPRSDHADKYETVELGFPSKKEESIMEYAEDPEDPTGTVYGHVPIYIVDELLKKHGGITDIVKVMEKHENES